MAACFIYIRNMNIINYQYTKTIDKNELTGYRETDYTTNVKAPTELRFDRLGVSYLSFSSGYMESLYMSKRVTTLEAWLDDASGVHV